MKPDAFAQTRFVPGSVRGFLFSPATLLCLLIPATVSGGPVTVQPAGGYQLTKGLRVAIDGNACGDNNHETVPQSVTGSESVRACETVGAGSAVVSSGAHLDVLAGYRVTFGNGFRIESGGSMAVNLDAARVRGGFVQDNSPFREPHYAARFWLNADNLALDSNARLTLLEGLDAGGRSWWMLKMKWNAAANEVRLYVVAAENTGSQSTESANEIVLSSGWHAVELEWKAAQPGSSDGFILVELDGASQPGLSGLANDEGVVELVRWGVLNALSTTDGWLDLDNFVSRRAGRIGPTP